MKKNIFFTLYTFIIIIGLSAQVNLEFGANYGCSGEQHNCFMTTDSLDNFYCIGNFGFTIDANPILGPATYFTTTGGTDIFINKLNASEDFVWAKSIGGFYDDVAYSIAVDAFGYVYVTGTFQDIVDFDPNCCPNMYNMTSAGSNDIFVLKLDSMGNFVWARRMGGTGNDVAKSIVVDPFGNVYTTGWFAGTADFDPGAGVYNLVADASTNLFVSKLNAAGNFVWAFRLPANGGNAITLDNVGNVYVTAGYRKTNIDFDPGPGTFIMTSPNSYDVFVLKVDSNANFLWAKQMGGPYCDDNATSISVSQNGDVYTTGHFLGAADFDPGPSVYTITSIGYIPLYSGPTDGFISKLDNNGNFKWVKTIGGASNDKAISIVSSDDLGVYTTGFFQGTSDFDPGIGTFNLTSAGSDDIFVLKLDTAGDFGWAVRMGGPVVDNSQSIALTPLGNVYTTGLFKGIADFDPGPDTFDLDAGNAVYFDGYVTKFSQDFCAGLNSTNAINVMSCAPYLSPAGNNYSLSGTYMDTIPNMGGCDSVITINLTIQNNGSSLSAIQCYSYSLNSITYTSSGTYNQTLTNQAGCDSILTLNLIILDSTFSTINASACDSFTLNTTTYNSSGTYYQTLPNSTGCDSIITINLSISGNSFSTITANACENYVLNSISYDSTGVFSQIVPNSLGCDSTITLNLTINNVDNTLNQSGNTLTANQSGGNYQWIDCNNFNSPIPGEINQSFTATANGNYALVVSANGCVDTSSCVSISGLGIVDDAYWENNLQVFPNPTSSTIFISSSFELIDAFVQITNISGQVILTKANIYGKGVFIDMTQFSPSMYFIQLDNQEKTITMKIVKN